MLKVNNTMGAKMKALEKTIEHDEEETKKRLANYYKRESAKLEKEINAFYQKYGEDNVIEYRHLLEVLDPADQQLLIERAEEFAKKYPEYAHLIDTRKAIYRLNRLEGLQESIRLQQLENAAKETDMLKQHFTEVAKKSLRTGENIVNLKPFYSVNRDIVESFVDRKWSNGLSYSERIYKNHEQLTNYLNSELSSAMARGDSYDRIVKDVMSKFDGVSRNNAYRLVYTEGTRIMAESSMKPFEEDFEYYNYEVQDSDCCDICDALASGGPYKIKDRMPGDNFPPMHPWCRCTFTPYVEDWDKWMKDYTERHKTDKEQAEKIKEVIK